MKLKFCLILFIFFFSKVHAMDRLSNEINKKIKSNIDIESYDNLLNLLEPSTSDYYMDLIDGVTDLLFKLKTDFNPLYVQKIDLESKEEAIFFIFGDIHGSFFTLDSIIRCLIDKEILDKQLNILNDSNKFIFLGDYINRGPDSVKLLLVLFCLQVINPNNVIILQGNHEAWDIDGSGGFIEDFEVDLYHTIKSIKCPDVINLDEKLIVFIVRSYFNKFYMCVVNLPVACFVRLESGRIFQFNHSCWGRLEDIGFLSSCNAGARISTKEAKGFLWNDLIIKNKDFLDRRIGRCYTLDFIFKQMNSLNIVAKFGGHNHILPKSENSDELGVYSKGFCFLEDSKKEHKIFTLISGRIMNTDINYFPSFLKLEINSDDSYKVLGYCIQGNTLEEQTL